MSRNFDPNKPRCYLVYALAPEAVPMGDADRVFNDFIAQPGYGLVLYHDHFIDCTGGCAIFWTENEDQYHALTGAAELTGWRVAVHPLTFSDSGSGFLAQIEFTLKHYRGMSVENLRQIGKSRWAKETA